MTHTELQTIGGKPVLRFERLLVHSPEKVWSAVTEPDQMRHWFPASVETDLVIGAPMRFRFEGDDDATPGPMKDGEILELDPPKVYAFRWNEDVLRFELLPQVEGASWCSPTRLRAGRWAGWPPVATRPGGTPASTVSRRASPPERHPRPASSPRRRRR